MAETVWKDIPGRGTDIGEWSLTKRFGTRTRNVENTCICGGTDISRGNVQMEKFREALWSSACDYTEAVSKFCTVFVPWLAAKAATEEWVGHGRSTNTARPLRQTLIRATATPKKCAQNHDWSTSAWPDCFHTAAQKMSACTLIILTVNCFSFLRTRNAHRTNLPPQTFFQFLFCIFFFFSRQDNEHNKHRPAWEDSRWATPLHRERSFLNPFSLVNIIILKKKVGKFCNNRANNTPPVEVWRLELSKKKIRKKQEKNNNKQTKKTSWHNERVFVKNYIKTIIQCRLPSGK